MRSHPRFRSPSPLLIHRYRSLQGSLAKTLLILLHPICHMQRSRIKHTIGPRKEPVFVLWPRYRGATVFLLTMTAHLPAMPLRLRRSKSLFFFKEFRS